MSKYEKETALLSERLVASIILECSYYNVADRYVRGIEKLANQMYRFRCYVLVTAYGPIIIKADQPGNKLFNVHLKRNKDLRASFVWNEGVLEPFTRTVEETDSQFIKAAKARINKVKQKEALENWVEAL